MIISTQEFNTFYKVRNTQFLELENVIIKVKFIP